MSSVGEDLPGLIEEAEQMRETFRGLGQSGAFVVHQLNGSLERARAAQASGDVVAIVRAYADLKAYFR